MTRLSTAAIAAMVMALLLAVKMTEMAAWTACSSGAALPTTSAGLFCAAFRTNRAASIVSNRAVFEVFVRGTAAMAAGEGATTLLPSLRLFWPHVPLSFILDDESESDHRFWALGEAERLAAPLALRVGFAPPTYAHILSGKDRMHHDTVCADAYTNATFVGFADMDSLFTSWVTDDVLFAGADTPAPKPKIIGIVGRPFNWWWVDVPVRTQEVLRKESILTAMSMFPLIVRTAHLPLFRAQVSAAHGGRAFDDVWINATLGHLCQYDILVNYLWWFHRDEYAWTLQPDSDGVDPNPPPGAMTRVAAEAAIDAYRQLGHPNVTSPIVRIAVHGGYYEGYGKQGTPSQEAAALRGAVMLPGFCLSYIVAAAPANDALRGIPSREAAGVAAAARVLCEPLAASGALAEPIAHLFDFESSSLGPKDRGRRWTWDKQGCLVAQQEYTAAMVLDAERPTFRLSAVLESFGAMLETDSLPRHIDPRGRPAAKRKPAPKAPRPEDKPATQEGGDLDNNGRARKA